MPGRNAKPVALHIAEGNPNRLTKADIEKRQNAEIKLGKSELDKLKPPPFVQNDAIAYKYWKQHIKEYKDAAKNGIEILSSSDVGTLALYCKTYSEYESLIRRKQRLESIDMVSQSKMKGLPRSKARNDLNEIMIMDTILSMETAINKKMDMLLKMQDRLFLNPLAKVKNVPKREKEKASNPMEDEYGI